MFANVFHPQFNFFRRDYWFGQVDSRPLGLFRILFAGWLLKDALLKFFLIDTFYSEQGVLPHETMSVISNPLRFTLLDLFTAAWMVYILLGIWVVVLVLLMVGYRARLMAVLNFIFVLSFLERNLFIGSAADTVFRVMSFWMMFIPLGRSYSIDAVLRNARAAGDLPAEGSDSRMIYAFPVRMLQLQFALIYLFSFLIKIQHPAWTTGNALFYSLQMSLYVSPIGEWFTSAAPYGILIYLTYFTLVMEGGFPLFVFAPFWQPTLRQLGLLLGVMLHIGIAFFMSIPNFSAVMIICYSAFFLPEWMDVVDRYAHKVYARLLIARHFGQRLARLFAPDATPNSRTNATTHPDFSVPLRDEEPDGEPAAPRAIHRIGAAGRPLLAGMLALLFVWTAWWNVGTLNLSTPDGEPILGYPQGLAESVVRITGLRQRWVMFIVRSEGAYGWVSVPARFADQSTRDLLAGDLDPEVWYRTNDLTGSWRKYSSNLWNSDSTDMRAAYADYHCRQYAAQNVVSLDIVYNYRFFHYPNEAPNPVNQRTMLTYDCLRSQVIADTETDLTAKR